MRATQYFSGLVKDHGGSILVPVGRYNGWNLGMTYVWRSTSCLCSDLTCVTGASYCRSLV